MKSFYKSWRKFSTTEEYIELTATWKSFGISSFNSIYVGQDDKNSSEYITFLSQGGLGLPDVSYYTNTDQKAVEIQESYKAYMAQILEMAGQENTEQAALTIYDIEKLFGESVDDKSGKKKSGINL